MKKIIGIIFIFISPFQLFGQESKNYNVQKYPALHQLLLETGADRDIQNGSFGFYALNTKTGEVIGQFNCNQSLLPASTMKVITTATALELFGSRHQFKTTLEYDGFIDENCILQGDLYIKGGGDPTLGSSYFFNQHLRFKFLKEWAEAVLMAGIYGINGSIIADDQIFSGEVIPSSWAWGDIGNYYGACATGLSVFDNVFELEFSSGGVGELAKINNTFPFIPYMQLSSEVKGSNAADDNAFIFGGPNSFQRIVRGEIPAGKASFLVKGAIPDPPLLAAFALNEVLKKYGVVISAEPATVSRVTLKTGLNPKRKEIKDFNSPELGKIVYWTNMKSVNSFAEHLLNHIGLQKFKSGNTESGTKAITDFWKIKGIDTQGMFISDGSGLSRANGITARQMAEVIKHMTGSSEFDAFYNSLPVAGKSGSIASICKGTSAEGNLRAKSGYLNRVRSYTGYVHSKRGNLIAFAIIANNYTCTATQMKLKLEKVMIELADIEE